ncbi:MAG: SprT family zinc-dependent metalloprotease [Eubacteriales bacterium]|nr:SprT family zinc-dependent metalloprotease [Eubacteriales bacterium]
MRVETACDPCYTATMELQRYALIRSRRKTIAIRILPDGGVEVRAPLRTPKAYIDAVVMDKAAWIKQKSAEMETKAQVYPPHRFLEGERFFLLGEPLYLTYCGGIKKPLWEEDRLLIPQAEPERVKAMLERWYKALAREFFTERLNLYAPLCGVTYRSVKLSSADGRWGSCSRSGNINLTWRLIMAPADIIDYVAVHELCHIKAPNHQSEFWASVQTVIPDYKEKRAWLNAHAHELQF